MYIVQRILHELYDYEKEMFKMLSICLNDYFNFLYRTHFLQLLKVKSSFENYQTYAVVD